MAKQGAYTINHHHCAWFNFYKSSDAAITQRRGLSTVVGSTFALIALVTTVVYISYSMHMLDSYAQTFLAINQVRSDMQKEQFKITTVSLPNNKFNITVQNTGPIPINITRLWVQNTTTTNWVAKYPTSSTITPGGTISNIGQNIPGSINTANAYYVKLVTSRGNTQAFTVNSASSAPLNIQLLALPPTVSSGFTTELVMIVTNNGTSVLTNLVPQISEQPGFTATCNLSPVSPIRYNTLSPGNTAVFKWDLTVSGTQGGQSCTWIGQLQNGYPGNIAQVSVTTNAITVSTSSITSSFSVISGVLTMNYSTFKWTQGNQWNNGWFLPGNQPTGFSVRMTNNNATGDFYISQQTFFWFATTFNGNPANKNFAYIVNSVGLSPFSISKYSCGGNDYCIMIPHGGGTVTLYFGDTSPECGCSMSLPSSYNYDAFLLMYGKFATSQSATGTPYGQNIPFVAILTR